MFIPYQLHVLQLGTVKYACILNKSLLSTHCFAHLVVLSLVVAFDWKLVLTRLLRLISLVHWTTKLPFSLAQTQNLFVPGNQTWVFPALHSL